MVDKQELKKVGLKVTLPRMKVLNILDSALKRHLSAEEIHNELLNSGEDVGLATVYRVLTQFETAGLVKRHNFAGDHSVFELDQGAHHDHLVCIKCNRVIEFVDDIIEQRQRDVAADKGFQITDHSLNIYGLCGECQ